MTRDNRVSALPLVALRLPAGWSVVFNVFHPISPEDARADAALAGLLCEDLLSLERRSGAGEVDLFVDLGWLPDGDPNGGYRLKLLHVDREAPLARCASRDWRTIAATIDRWLATAQPLRGLDALDRAFAAERA